MAEIRDYRGHRGVEPRPRCPRSSPTTRQMWKLHFYAIIRNIYVEEKRFRGTTFAQDIFWRTKMRLINLVISSIREYIHIEGALDPL